MEDHNIFWQYVNEGSTIQQCSMLGNIPANSETKEKKN